MPIIAVSRPPTGPAPYVAAVTTITDPAGTDWPLDGTRGLWLKPGRRGFHAPSYVHYRDESPAVPGAFWRGVRATVRELFIPIVIVGANREDLLATRRDLIAAIGPERGECVISTTYPNGSRRSITCRYVDGMEGEEGEGEWGVTKQAYGLRFVADDPYLYGDEITVPWGSNTVTRTELPIPGADGFYEVVSAAQLLGTATVDNLGDVEAYPHWQFFGPFTAITLANSVSGKTLSLTHTAATGANWIAIETKPGHTSIVDQGGTNRWATLTAGYSLWPLLPGEQTVTITVSGITDATRAVMTYRPQYRSA